MRQPIAAACETLLNLLIPKIKSKQTLPELASDESIIPLGPEQVLLEPELVIRGSA